MPNTPPPPSPRIIQLPRIYDPRGSLSLVEECRQVPFPIARVYWIYDVPAGEERGAHSHRELHQLLVAVAGSFDIELFDGFSTERHTLNRPFTGLHLQPGVWSKMTNFSSGCVVMSIVSAPYDEAEYIRDYEEFLQIAAANGPILNPEKQ